MPYSFFRAVTVDHTKVPNTDLTNYPVGFIGTYAWLATVANGGRAQNASGYDAGIPFTDTLLSSPLAHELVDYNATTGAIERYVKQPTLSHSVDDVIYAAVGDASVTTDGSSTSTWNANFKAVYHFGDHTTLSLNDSTANANHLTGVNTPTLGAGPVAGGAVTFNGTSQYAWRSANAAVTAWPITYSALFNPTNTTSNGEFVSQAQQAANIVYPVLVARTSAVLRASIGGAQANSGNTYSASAWNYAVARFISDTDRRVILNAGTEVQNTTSQTLSAPDDISLGARSVNSVHNSFYPGLLDEVRISNVDRGQDWATTEFNNLTAPSTFYAIGTEQATTPPATSRPVFGSNRVRFTTPRRRFV